MTRPDRVPNATELRGHLAAIVESSDDAILSKDLDGIIRTWNRGAERLYGYAAEEVIGRPVSILVPDDQAAEFSEIMECLRRGDRVDHYETDRLTRDGTRRRVSLTVSPIRNEKGRIVGASAVARDITEQETMREGLRRREQQWRLALDAAEMGTWDYDIAAGRLFWDDRTAGFFGLAGTESLPLEEAVARIHEDDRARVRSTIAEAVGPASDGRYDMEYRIIRNDGGERWIRSVGQTLFAGEGDGRRAERFVGVVFEVTEARAAREALREANERAERNLERLEAVIGQMTEGIVISDPEGHILSMNDVALAFHDLRSDREVQRHLDEYGGAFDLFEVDDGEPIPVKDWPLARALRGETFADREVRVRNRRSGRTWIGSYGGTPVRDSRGRVQLAIVTLRDITARREAEQALRESRERERERADELAALMESVPAVVWIAHDPECRRITGSRAAYEILGMHPGSNLSQSAPEGERPHHFVSYYRGRRLAPHELPLQRAARGEHVRHFEEEVRFTDGTRRHLFGNAVPLRDELGGPRGALGAFVDITEQRHLVEQLEALNESLERRVAERTAEAETRAEQLRLMAAELTDAEQRERRRLAQLLHDELQQILVAAHMRLSHGSGAGNGPAPEVVDLLEQALETSRSLSTELAPPVLYELGLASALEWLVRWVREKYGLEVEMDSDDGVEVEHEQLRVLLFQAVRELLFNVVKHAGVREARLTLRRTADEIQVIVEDPGRGFDPEEAVREEKKQGFGLFSLQERLALLDGRLRIESVPAEGTRILVSAPLRSPLYAGEGGRPTARGSEPSTPGVVPAGAPVDGPRTRVLLTDDHDVVRRGLAEIIDEQPDMEVVAEAASGEDAVEGSRRHRPDVVVMDISLPGMSGIEATRQIVAELPDTRVIGLSIHEEEDVTTALRSAGARAYFNKGQGAETLVRAIRRLAPIRG